MAEDGYKVTLNVYDLSQGLARQLSVTFLGKAIEGICGSHVIIDHMDHISKEVQDISNEKKPTSHFMHTGLVVYGNEYFFGGGIQQTPAGTTHYGTPVKTVDLGVTHVPQQLFEEYLLEISPRYTAETYNLLHHNCNNFSNEVAQFLVGATIPDYILQLPNEVMSSPMGPMILPMIKQLETTMRVNAVPQAPHFSSATVARSTQQVNDVSEKDTLNSDAVENTTISDIHPTDTGNTPEKIPEKKVNDPLGEARSKVQEEIGKEFATIMATGTLRASEAAALATRRVMERHGQLNSAVPQG